MANDEDYYAENKEDTYSEINSRGINSETPPDKIAIPGEIDPNAIQINNIEGPLVVFFGPRSIGKTVTLLRLCSYMSQYDVTPDPTFRTDEEYQSIIREFERLRRDFQFAPPATGMINFLLLNVTYRGERFCQILEAPGEHYFDETKHDDPYFSYFNEILNRSYKKIFIFFFSINMFKTDQSRRNYANKIARLVNNNIISTRDRVIIVCNKCDENPYIRNGKPVDREYKSALYKHEAFGSLAEVLSRSGLGRIPFVPFSAGTFVTTGKGRLAFSLSPDHYPQRLWHEIHECVVGESLLGSIRRLLGV